ncbi:hypothetical protein CYCD_11760 [Tenuifilaceae bacterium CYCD]|nr:hypothetical protein CYCD_11760 [Tenuifilaceae bacterium CYCD]
MEFKSQLTRQDYLEFNKYILFKTRIKRNLIFVIVITLLWIVLLNYNQPLDFIAILIELIVFSILWSTLYLLIYGIAFLKIRKMPDENGSILEEKTYIFSEEGLKQISTNSESFTKWNAFKSIEENKKYIFLFVDKIAAYVIPKRVFQDSKEMNDFVDFLKGKIKK